MLVVFYKCLMYSLMIKWTIFYLVDILFSKIVGLIELGIGLIELGIGLIELGIGLRINNARRTVLARVSGLVSYIPTFVCSFISSIILSFRNSA